MSHKFKIGDLLILKDISKCDWTYLVKDLNSNTYTVLVNNKQLSSYRRDVIENNLKVIYHTELKEDINNLLK